jgi:hypothetical protein
MISRIVLFSYRGQPPRLASSLSGKERLRPTRLTRRDTGLIGPCCQILIFATERPAVRPRWSFSIIHENDRKWKRALEQVRGCVRGDRVEGGDREAARCGCGGTVWLAVVEWSVFGILPTALLRQAKVVAQDYGVGQSRFFDDSGAVFG